MPDEKTKSRLDLADQLFHLATGFSEIAMRNSLSRLYYAAFHVAAALTGGKGHADVIVRLSREHGAVGDDLKRLHKLRSQMDYSPEFFATLGAAEPTVWFQDRMRDGIALYYQLRNLWEQQEYQGQ